MRIGSFAFFFRYKLSFAHYFDVSILHFLVSKNLMSTMFANVKQVVCMLLKLNA